MKMLLFYLIFTNFSYADDLIQENMLCSTTSKDFDHYTNFPVCRRNVSLKLKKETASKNHINESDFINYEFDHIIPLCLGGSNDISNLWVEPIEHAKTKDELEKKLCHDIRLNLISIVPAREMILKCKNSDCKATSLLNIKYFKN